MPAYMKAPIEIYDTQMAGFMSVSIEQMKPRVFRHLDAEIFFQLAPQCVKLGVATEDCPLPLVLLHVD